jgi:L-iditol 2-dehydrogenase
MRAAYIHGIRDLRVGDKAIPEPAANEVLLSVSAVGVCGSDLHYYKEGGIGSAIISQPFVPGHEFAGRVIEDRPDLGLKAGQLVAVDPAKPCGHCEWCERGQVNLCPNVEFMGAPPKTHGAMTELISAVPSQIFPVPDNFTDVQAVMLEPLGVAIHAMDLAKMKRVMETVAVIGCGPIGLCLLQLARMICQDKVFAVDPVGYRANLAKKLGADEIADRHTAIADWTNGRGVDLVLEATNSPMGFQVAAETVRIGGRIVLVGIPDGDQYVPLTASLLRRKGLDIRMSRRMGHVYERAIKLVATGRVDVDTMVTHRFALEDADNAFSYPAEFHDGAVKTIILPGQAKA